MKPVLGKWIFPGTLACLSFIADFCAKAWANAHLQYGVSQIFIPGLLRFTLTKNTGGAFGIGRGYGYVMALLAISIVASIIFWISKRESSASPPTAVERLGVGFIIGGAMGNLFDRFARGEVTDFLEFTFIDFPVFNIADAIIDLGAFLVIVGAIGSGKPSTQVVDPKINETESPTSE